MVKKIEQKKVVKSKKTNTKKTVKNQKVKLSEVKTKCATNKNTNTKPQKHDVRNVCMFIVGIAVLITVLLLLS